MDEITVVNEIVLGEGSPLEAKLVIQTKGALRFDGYVEFNDAHFNREGIMPWFIPEDTLPELIEAAGKRLHNDLVVFAGAALHLLVIRTD